MKCSASPIPHATTTPSSSPLFNSPVSIEDIFKIPISSKYNGEGSEYNKIGRLVSTFYFVHLKFSTYPWNMIKCRAVHRMRHSAVHTTVPSAEWNL